MNLSKMLVVLMIRIIRHKKSDDLKELVLGDRTFIVINENIWNIFIVSKLYHTRL